MEVEDVGEEDVEVLDEAEHGAEAGGAAELEEDLRLLLVVADEELVADAEEVLVEQDGGEARDERVAAPP